MDIGAKEEYYSNGVLKVHRCYDANGHLHCEDGPAIMWLNEDGRSVAAVYCLGGERISKREHRRRAALRKLAASAVAGKPGVSLWASPVTHSKKKKTERGCGQ